MFWDVRTLCRLTALNKYRASADPPEAASAPTEARVTHMCIFNRAVQSAMSGAPPRHICSGNTPLNSISRESPVWMSQLGAPRHRPSARRKHVYSCRGHVAALSACVRDALA
jgi:hypothetical protein